MRAGKIFVKMFSGYVRGGILSFILSLVITGLLVLPGCGPKATPVIGHPTPDFTLTDLDGNSVRLRDFRGKVVFLNFWAIECPPCRAEMPAMEEVYQEYRDEDVVIIGINLGEPVSMVQSFVDENGYSWTFVIDTNGQVTWDYMVALIPTSFFIDKKGIIRALYVGPMSRFGMEARLTEAMQ